MNNYNKPEIRIVVRAKNLRNPEKVLDRDETTFLGSGYRIEPSGALTTIYSDGENDYTQVSVRYCIELSIEEMEAIMRKDKHNQIGLVDLLAPASDIEYDPIFGAAIWFTLSDEDDTRETRLKIQSIVSKYCLP